MRIDGMPLAGMPITAPTERSSKTNAFGDMFMKSLAETNRSQANVENLIERTVAGEDVNPATMAAAVNKADLAIRTMIQIRNKLTQAFDELRQMQV